MIYPLESGPVNHDASRGSKGENSSVKHSVLDKISERVNAEDNGDFGAIDLNASNVIEIHKDFEYQAVSVETGAEGNPDQTVEIELDQLMPEQYRGNAEQKKKIRAKGTIQFVVMREEKGQISDDAWGFFPREELEKIINNIEVANSLKKNGLSIALDYANMWGNIPIIGLRASHLDAAYLFREEIEHYDCPNYTYTTFPRAGLTKKLAFTAMLWQNLRHITLDAIPRNLLDRNPGLQGGVRISRCKNFKSTDTDSRGNPMAGVRLIQLETDQEFRDSIYHFPRSYRFGLGCGRIIIRGGERVEEPPTPVRGRWAQGPPKNRANGGIRKKQWTKVYSSRIRRNTQPNWVVGNG